MIDDRVRIAVEPHDSPEVRVLFKAMYDDLMMLYGEDDDPDGTMPIIDFQALDGVFVMARIDGAAVGCGGIRRYDADTAEVKRIFVAETYRGHGISRAIMLELQERARALGYRRLVLETGAKQVAAVNLYESLGYTRIPDFGEYVGDPLTRCYEKLLL